MHHLEHINQDTCIKRRYSKDKDSTVNKAEYRSKRNKTGKAPFERFLSTEPVDPSGTISIRFKQVCRTSPCLHNSVDFIFLSFGILMGFIVEL